MEILTLNFDADYFSWLLSVVTTSGVFGVLIPVGFWGLGFLVKAFFKWVMS